MKIKTEYLLTVKAVNRSLHQVTANDTTIQSQNHVEDKAANKLLQESRVLLGITRQLPSDINKNNSFITF